jgi:hypothetical protein
MAATFASQAMGLRLAVGRRAAWLEISPYPNTPEFKLRVYLRGDLSRVPPQQLKAVIERGRNLVAGQVWKGKNLQVRKTADPLGDYLEVYPKGATIPPPFSWEESDALGNAVALHHDQAVLDRALAKADPRYLVFLSAYLRVASDAVREGLERIEWRRRLLEHNPDARSSVREGNSTKRDILFYIGRGTCFNFPAGEELTLAKPPEKFEERLKEAAVLYAGFQEKVKRVLAERFLKADQYLDFASFLLRLAVSDENRENDFVPSSARGGLPLPYRQQAAYWGLGYVGEHASKEQTGWLDLLDRVEHWAEGPDKNREGRQTASIETAFGLLKIQAASVRQALLVKGTALSAA